MGTYSFKGKTYEIDSQGFLLNHDQWDEDFAVGMAQDVNITGGLSDKHWQIIHYLRDCLEKDGAVPRVFECCEANKIELDELEKLFPDGYHRGAVRIAGLRVR